MKRAALVSVALILGGWTAEPGRTAAPAESTPSPGEAAALVSQLGSDSYRTREEASRRLLQLGRAAIPAVRAGLKDADAEVRHRCADLLPRIDRPELEPRLTALLDGQEKFDPPLPGWERFRDLAGFDASARLLYIDLYQADRPWLELIQRDAKQAGSQVAARTQRLQQRLWNLGAVASTGPRTTPAELAGLFLAASSGPGDLPSFYSTYNLFHQWEVQGYVRGNPALRKLVARYLAGRTGDANTFNLTIYAARMLELHELLEGTLKPAVLRQVDSALSQPPDLNRLVQAANLINTLEMQNQLPPRFKAVAARLAQDVVRNPGDYQRFYQVVNLLQALRMQQTLDDVVKPAVYQLARSLGERTADLNQFYQAFHLCQIMNLPEATEALKPAACKLIVTAAAHPEDQGRFMQAFFLARNLNLTEAQEGLLRPAALKHVLAVLEQPDNLAQFRQACNLALQANPELIEDTLKPVLRRQARTLLEKPASLAVMSELFQVAQQINARDVIDDQVKPALRKVLTAETAFNPATFDQGLYLARTLQMKEGTTLALKGAKAPSLPIHSRANAVLFVAGFGTAEQAAQLEPFLTDATPVGALNTGTTTLQAQFRDVVLATLVHTHGLKLGDYGFSQFANPGVFGFGPSPSYFGFAGDTDRAKALDQWKKWSADRKK
jgi:hypothetical protein